MELRKKAHLSIIVICGVRPQFVKCAAFQKAVTEFNKTSTRQIDAMYINSGQHYDDQLAGVFIRELGLHFDYTIVHENKTPGHIMGEMISQISDFIVSRIVKPDWVVIFGDANTTVAGAIAANKCQCQVVHFEAGTALKDLRTPEIINGKLISHLANIQFCSTEMASESLRKQGITSNVFVIGDVARDFIIDYSKGIKSGYQGFEPGEYILLTLHREENLESKKAVQPILNFLSKYSKTIFVTHPRTQQKLNDWGINSIKNITLIPSLSYSNMLSVIKGSRFIITDSGGLQREAYYLGKRCLVYSEVDFWPSLRLAEVHKIISANTESISNGIKWVEEKIANGDYPVVDNMNQKKAAHRALEILTRLA